MRICPKAMDQLQPTWAGAAHISKIVMIGVPNEGSADAFATLIEGYSVTEGLRRRVPLLNKLTAEDVVRTPSVFQLLPHRQAVKFLDENLQALEVDLYDPEVWKRYGWSVIYSSSDFRRRYSETTWNKWESRRTRRLSCCNFETRASLPSGPGCSARFKLTRCAFGHWW